MLDLLRRLSAGAPQQSQSARANGLPGPWLGLLLAERHPHSVQPLFGASGWQAVERAQEAYLVGWREARMDGTRYSRFRQTQAAGLQTEARFQGYGRHCGRQAIRAAP